MPHQFGGAWTTEKLRVVRKYFERYAIALKNQPFQCWYIDAFAGTGERLDSDHNYSANDQLFGDDVSDVRETKDGSAQIALQIEPAFSRYIFIEASRRRADELSEFISGFADLNVEVIAKDANEVLVELARDFPRNVRAAIFIDPYGMQVRWETLEALGRTKAVDIALLFPTGPLNRLLRRDSKLPEEWVQAINLHLGPCDWQSAVYQPVAQKDLFDGGTDVEKVVTVEQLQAYVRERLKTIFAYVHPEIVTLRNSRGSILYDLLILTANPSPKAIQLAKRLASSAIQVSRR
ncbi:MAG: three-Cys-motif partner protein TcmP [Beijerinckiaceae bacterium]